MYQFGIYLPDTLSSVLCTFCLSQFKLFWTYKGSINSIIQSTRTLIAEQESRLFQKNDIAFNKRILNYWITLVTHELPTTDAVWIPMHVGHFRWPIFASQGGLHPSLQPNALKARGAFLLETNSDLTPCPPHIPARARGTPPHKSIFIAQQHISLARSVRFQIH